MPVGLRVGDEFLYHGVKHIVFSFERENILFQREGGDGTVKKMEYISLISDPSFEVNEEIRKKVIRETNKQGALHNSLLDTLSDKQRAKVSKRFEMIAPLLMFDKAKGGDFVSNETFKDIYSEYLDSGEGILGLSKEQLFEQIGVKYKVHPRTVKRYYYDYIEEETNYAHHGLNKLIPKPYKSNVIRSDETLVEICHPKRKDLVMASFYVRLDPVYVPILKTAIEKKYLNKRRVSIQHVVESIESLCTVHPQHPESLGYDTVYNILNRLDPKLKEFARNTRSAIQTYNPVTEGFTQMQAKAPLHIVEIDHTELDIDCIDEVTGENLGRPWITLGIDLYTRMVWCMHISFEPPSADKVRKAIEHGLFLKKAKQRFGTRNEWELSGFPTIIYTDNGPEFDNADVRRMIEETLKGQAMYRPIATPRYGGAIERLFGTINKQFIHNQMGTRKSNVTDLGDYDAEGEAIFTLNDIREIMTQYITDIYHHKVHNGLPLDQPTPVARYLSAIEVLGNPDFVYPEDEAYYHMELLPVKEKRYRRDGIREDNVKYLSAETSRFINPNKKYKIKYDIGDISHIYLLDPDTGNYHLVPAQNPPASDLTGMDRGTYKELVGILRRKGILNSQGIPGSRDLALARAELEKKINRKIKSNKKLRRTAAERGYSFVQIPTYSNSGPSKSKLEQLKAQLDLEMEQIKREQSKNG